VQSQEDYEKAKDQPEQTPDDFDFTTSRPDDDSTQDFSSSMVSDKMAEDMR
jgi:hypothetical protein